MRKRFFWRYYRLGLALVIATSLCLIVSCTLVTRDDFYKAQVTKYSKRKTCDWYDYGGIYCRLQCKGISLEVIAAFYGDALSFGVIVPIIPTFPSRAQRRKAQEEKLHVDLNVKADERDVSIFLNKLVVVINKNGLEQRLSPISCAEWSKGPFYGKEEPEARPIKCLQVVQSGSGDHDYRLLYPIKIKEVSQFTLIFPTINVGKETIIPKPIRFEKKTTHDFEAAM